MKFSRSANLASVLLTGMVFTFPIQTLSAQQPAAPAPAPALTKPEAVGFSSARLERVHTLMQQAVDEKKVAGVVTILARHGKVVEYRTYGKLDMNTGPPMSKDAIFRDYSMTKPVTGVAMMILYEQGKWQPSDPIA